MPGKSPNSAAISEPISALAELYRRHPRRFEEQRYVYPVLSRRSLGISVGVNLNPDKICNFDCIYCQVDRTVPPGVREVDLELLLEELEGTLQAANSGQIYQMPSFRDVPPDLRRLNDIAFSGDGEPTTCRDFDRVTAACAAVKDRLGLDEVKMVLITNATMFHRPQVQRGLAILDSHQGEIWAKLEAGTEAYYQRVERTSIPLKQVLANITAAAQVRPLVIQALFMRIDGQPPPAPELAAFCERLNEIVAAAGRIRLVQVYTVARPPAESFVMPLSALETSEIAQLVRTRTGLPAEAFH